jgi:hypothetical protein
MIQHEQQVMNTWHISTADAPTMPTVLQGWVDGMITAQRNDTAASVEFNHLEYRRVDISGTSFAIYTPTSWPLAGADSGADLPSFAAWLIKGVASGQPRPNRIRKFLPGIIETDSSGSVSAGTGDTKLAAIVAAWQSYVDGDPVAAWPLAVSYINPTTGQQEDNVDGRWNQITDFTSSNVIRGLKSRKLGVGM